MMIEDNDDQNFRSDRSDVDYGPEPTNPGQLDLNLDAGEDEEDEVKEGQQEEEELDADGNPVPTNNGGEEDYSIEIEGEEPARENNVMRELRETARRQARELAQLRAAQAPQKVELGKKPDLWEDCDGDAELFEAQLTDWHSRKSQADQQAQAMERSAAEAAEQWAKVEGDYTAKATALGVKDFRKHEERVVDTLNPDLLKAIKFYMRDPAKVVAALGANPRLLERISAEADPIKALFELRDVEGKINVKRKPPKPESSTIPRGNAPVSSGNANKQLARLEADADKSGDRTALIAYKKQLAAKGGK